MEDDRYRLVLYSGSRNEKQGLQKPSSNGWLVTRLQCAMRKIALASKVFKTSCFAAVTLHAVVNLQTLAVAEEESILDQATVLTASNVADVDT